MNTDFKPVLTGLLNEISFNSNAYYTATFVDSYIVDAWDRNALRMLEEKSNKLLELRVFDEDKEMKVWRSDLGSTIRYRIIDDTNPEGTYQDKYFEDKWDEIQLLDIDERRTAVLSDKSKGNTVMIGGGLYYLPHVISALKKPGLKIRYYPGRYDNTGLAYVKDWRCVCFTDREGRSV